MNGSTKSLIWILLALLLFAIGFVGFGVYQSVHTKQIQSQPAPVVPSVPVNG